MSWIAFEVSGLSLVKPTQPGLKFVMDRPKATQMDDALLVGASVRLSFIPIFAHKVTDGDDDGAEDRLRLFVDLARVLLLLPVSCDHAIWFESYDDESETQERELSERRGSWIEGREIDENDLARLRTWWPQWVAQASKLESVLPNFERAVLAQTPAESVAWTIAALESMLASDKSESSAYRVQLRAALAATDDHEKRRWWFDVLKQAYDVRSRVMHGSAKKIVATSMHKLGNKVGGNEEHAADEVLRLFSSICLGVVGRLALGQSLETFGEELDHALLSTNVPEATNIIEFPKPVPEP